MKKDSQSSLCVVKALQEIKKSDSYNSINKEMNDSFLNPKSEKSENISNLRDLSLKSNEHTQPENDMLDCNEGFDSKFNNNLNGMIRSKD